MGIRAHAHDSADAFMDVAGDWLLADEAANNLLLGIVRRLDASREQYEPPILLLTLHDDAGHVIGCAWRTPPYKLGLTAMPEEAATRLVPDVARVYESLPAVLGPPAVAEAFAHAWAERMGIGTQPGMRQRVYRLDRVVPPASPPAGHLRLAASADLDLMTRWVDAFTEEAAVPMSRAPDYTTDLIRRGRLFVWDDGEPRSMVGWGAETPNGVRIGPVYTPPHLRGRGFASAATAAASQRALDGGRRLCFLYTDLSNPTSNSIYTRIGYRPVADAMDWGFSA